MLIFGSVIAAVFPMTFYLVLLWRFDKYEREPLKIILKHFLWGAVGSIFFALIFSQLLNDFFKLFASDAAFISLLSVVLVAPLVEEIAKSSYLLKTTKSDQFDNLTDGIVYGGAIGLGFGMTENFFYFTTYGDSVLSWVFLVIVRTGFSAVMHCIATSIVGIFLAMAKFSNKENKFYYFILGLFIAMFIHFLWNFSVSFKSTYIFGYLALVTIIILYFLLLRYSLKRERKIILYELDDEDTPNFVFEFLNKKKSTINKNDNYKMIQLYCKLAFAKHIEKNKKGSKQNIQKKIDNIRLQILEKE